MFLCIQLCPVALQDLDLSVQKHLALCTSMHSASNSSSEFYQKQIDAGLKAWHTFIPHSFKYPYCWHAHFNVLTSTAQRWLTAWNDLRGIKKKYTTSVASTLVNLVLRRNISSWIARRLTNGTASQLFCLPNVYLAGFPKCGTTFLYSLITSHPLFAKPHSKEGNFWREFVKTADPLYKKLDVLHYLFHCKPAANQIETSEKKLTIDGSASTVFASPNTGVSLEKDVCILPSLLSKVLPDAKYIIIMRNPVERLWSDYWYFCAKSRWKVRHNNIVSYHIPSKAVLSASETFHNHSMVVLDDFQDCLQKHNSEFECVMRANSEDGIFSACQGARVGVGLYYFHIVKWLSILPSNRFLFLRMEDLIDDAFSVMLKVWEFLDVAPLTKELLDFHIENSVKKNANSWIVSEKYRSKFTMSPVTHRLLASFHQPYNLRLARLLKDDRFLWND